ncbi:MAG: hypothetical protein LBK03_07545 [Bacteroidales bacterium]|jgi:hypothetical protein|nr:hypothetical protein [Bacteroidales bacterium]
MKKIMIALLLFLIGNMALAQKNSWTIGFNYGLIGTVYQKGNTIDSYRNESYFPFFDTFPFSFELTVSYGITRYLSITTGIAHTYKEVWVKRKSVPFELTFPQKSHLESHLFCSYSSIEIPIKLNFIIPLGKSRFYFTGNMGVIIDVTIPDDGTWSKEDNWQWKIYNFNDEYEVSTGFNGIKYRKKVDFLINTGIGFGYRFKCGVGLSLTGAYNIGTRIMGELDIKNQLTFNSNGTPIFTSDPVLKEYIDRLYYKGDYWKVALGISYTFKQKKKE